MKLFNLAVASILTAIVATSCDKDDSHHSSRKKAAHTTSQISNTLRINIVSDPYTLDPRKARSLNDQILVKMLSDGLTRINAENTPELSLAESYTLSEDKKTYTFKLKTARWSDGHQIKASDFLYSYKTSLSPSFPSSSSWALFQIKNAKKIKNGELPSSMLGVNVIDEKTLSITLESPNPSFLSMLALPAFFPVPANVVRDNESWSENANTYISSGPFVLSEWSHNNKISAKKNEKYWDASKVKLADITLVMVPPETGIDMFEKNELDWEGSPLSHIPLDAMNDLKEKNLLHTKPALGTFFFRLNTNAPPLHSPSLRKALSSAIDRSELACGLFGATEKGADKLVPPSILSSSSELTQNQESMDAKGYLKTATSTENVSKSDLKRLTLTYCHSNRNHVLAQTIQRQWAHVLGIEVTLEPVEHKVIFSRLNQKDYQIALGSWIADYPDPLNFLEVFKNKYVGTNNTGWGNIDFEIALEKGRDETDSAKRQEIMKKCEAILMKEMPIIPLSYYSLNYVKAPHLKDVVLTQLGHIDFKWASIQKR